MFNSVMTSVRGPVSLAALLAALSSPLTWAQQPDASAPAAPAPAAAAAPTPPASLDHTRFMQGFPPPPEYRINRSNWQTWPYKIWGLQHTREFFPTKGLTPKGKVWKLPQARINLDKLPVGTPEAPQTWPEMLQSAHVDAVLVMHKGRIVEERYLKGMTPASTHLMFSATKSMVGLMGATLIAEGKLDPNARVGSIVPELQDSAWADATVAQVLDMTDGVRFSEIYTDPTSDIFGYIGATGWEPTLFNPSKPVGILDNVATLKKLHDEPRGTAFRYRSPATDVAAWVAARTAGQSLTSWLQERLWSRLGMEHEAHIMLDPVGTEVAFGGMSASLRDLARLGQMLLQEGRANGQQIIPKRVVHELAQGGDPKAFEAAGMAHRKGWSYKHQWWINPASPRFFAAMGAFGQRIFVFPEADVVAVMFSSHPHPSSAIIDPLHLRGLRAVIDHLQTARR